MASNVKGGQVASQAEASALMLDICSADGGLFHILVTADKWLNVFYVL